MDLLLVPLFYSILRLKTSPQKPEIQRDVMYRMKIDLSTKKKLIIALSAWNRIRRSRGVRATIGVYFFNEFTSFKKSK